MQLTSFVKFAALCVLATPALARDVSGSALATRHIDLNGAKGVVARLEQFKRIKRQEEAAEGSSDMGGASDEEGASDEGSSEEEGASDTAEAPCDPSTTEGSSEEGGSDEEGGSEQGASEEGGSGEGSSDEGASEEGGSDEGSSDEGASDTAEAPCDPSTTEGSSEEGGSGEGASEEGGSDEGGSDEGGDSEARKRDLVDIQPRAPFDLIGITTGIKAGLKAIGSVAKTVKGWVAKAKAKKQGSASSAEKRDVIALEQRAPFDIAGLVTGITTGVKAIGSIVKEIKSWKHGGSSGAAAAAGPAAAESASDESASDESATGTESAGDESASDESATGTESAGDESGDAYSSGSSYDERSVPVKRAVVWAA